MERPPGLCQCSAEEILYYLLQLNLTMFLYNVRVFQGTANCCDKNSKKKKPNHFDLVEYQLVLSRVLHSKIENIMSET